MRIVDKNGNTISSYDLTKGFLAPTRVIKENASPIDNIKKFAWYDEDYEDVQMYIEEELSENSSLPTNPLEERIAALEDLVKQLLATKG